MVPGPALSTHSASSCSRPDDNRITVRDAKSARDASADVAAAAAAAAAPPLLRKERATAAAAAATATEGPRQGPCAAAVTVAAMVEVGGAEVVVAMAAVPVVVTEGQLPGVLVADEPVGDVREAIPSRAAPWVGD